MIRKLAFVAGVFSFILSTVGPSQAAETRKFKMGQAGVAAILGSGVPGECISGPSPQVTVTSPPAHGVFKVRPFKVVMESGQCKGRTLMGTAIDYQPKAGFRGSDSISYQFSYDRTVQGTGSNYTSGTVEIIVE